MAAHPADEETEIAHVSSDACHDSPDPARIDPAAKQVRQPGLSRCVQHRSHIRTMLLQPLAASLSAHELLIDTILTKQVRAIHSSVPSISV